MSIYFNFALKCNASKIPPNKVEIIKVPIDRIGVNLKKNKILILKPNIDRLVIKFDAKKHVQETEYSENEFEDYKKGVASFLHLSTTDMDENLYQYVPNNILNDKRYRGWYQSYKKNVWLHHQPTGEKILIQAEPKNPSHAFFKFDFNPQELGKDGIEFFKEEIKHITLSEFDFDYIANQPQSITDLHICVDILGVDADHLNVEYFPHKNQMFQSKIQIIASEKGRTESIYPNFNKSHPSNVYFYNKKKEQIDAGVKAKYGEALHTRFEIRVKDIDKPLSKLSTLKNHLKKVDIEAADYGLLQINEHNLVFFIDYALRRNLEKALEQISDNHLKEEYKLKYNLIVTNIWNPEKLWSYWPETLKKSGLM